MIMAVKNKIYYGYTIVVCCFLIMFVIVGLVMSCAGIFYRPVSEDLGVDVGRFGIYMSLNFLFSTLTLSFAGKLMEKYSARWILTLCSILTGATYISMSFFNALWQFYTAGALLGFFLAFLLYLGFPTLLNRWFRTRMGLFIGICSAGSGIGGILFNPVAGYLISEYGWRIAYMLFGLVIIFIVSPILGIFLKDYPENKEIDTQVTDNRNNNKNRFSDGIEYAAALKMPIFYALVVFAFLMNASATLNIFVPSYVQSLNYTIEQASYAASSVMGGVTLGKILLGLINDRSSITGVLTTTGLGIIGLILLLFGKYGIALPVAGGFLFGWAYAGVTVQTPMLVRHVFGNKNYSRIYSNISMAIAIGGAIAAGGWGILADWTDYATILCLGILFLSISAVIGLYSLRVNRNNNI